MKILQYLSLLILVLFFSSCRNNSEEKKDETFAKTPASVSTEKSYPSYARLFSVQYRNKYKIVTVQNPFDTSKILKRYILIPKNYEYELESNLPDGKLIRTPVESMGIAFATHIGYAKKLGVMDQITGVSQKKYIKNKSIREGIDQGEIKEFGPSHNINVEKLLSINPQILLVAPFKDNRYEKITDVGIDLAINASYMENTPLARAEWIKFISYFFNKENKANQVFDSIASQYRHLQKLAGEPSSKPTLFSGKKIGQVWYVPGGNSYIAKFFEDAGANYLWSNNSSSGSLPLDFETVYMKAKDAEFWTFKENVKGTYSYDQLSSEHVHYKEFQAFQNRNVLFCNTHTKSYYEEGILEPHVILADLIHLLHPGLLPEHNPKYYELLKR